jgi:dihydroflavonol-4-reductase
MKAFVTGATGLLREYYGAGDQDHWPRLEAINVRGTLALGEAAHAQGVRRLVDTSSSGTIGIGPDGSPGDEETPPAAITRDNLYFRSKLVAAGKLRELAARTGLDVVQVLPGWMFGPGDAAPTASYAALAQTWARISGGETLLTVAGVRLMHARLCVSSAKAERELG